MVEMSRAPTSNPTSKQVPSPASAHRLTLARCPVFAQQLGPAERGAAVGFAGRGPGVRAGSRVRVSLAPERDRLKGRCLWRGSARLVCSCAVCQICVNVWGLFGCVDV